MTMRLRVVGWQVQPVLMADDDINLIPIPSDTRLINTHEWDQWKSGGDIQMVVEAGAKAGFTPAKPEIVQSESQSEPSPPPAIEEDSPPV